MSRGSGAGGEARASAQFSSPLLRSLPPHGPCSCDQLVFLWWTPPGLSSTCRQLYGWERPVSPFA